METDRERSEHDINCGIDPLHLGEDIGCTCYVRDEEDRAVGAPPAPTGPFDFDGMAAQALAEHEQPHDECRAPILHRVIELVRGAQSREKVCEGCQTRIDARGCECGPGADTYLSSTRRQRA